MLFSQAHRSRATSRAYSTSHRQSRATSIPTSSLQRAFNLNWCCSTFALLKWIEIVLCIVLVTLIEAGVHRWKAYGFIMFISAACAVLTLAGLATKFCQLQTGRGSSLPFDKLDISFNIFALVGFSIAFALSCYYCVMVFDESQGHPASSSPRSEDWRNRIIAITILCGTNALFYTASTFHSKRSS